MLQDQFTNLSILHIEKDLTKSIESEDVLNMNFQNPSECWF